MLIDTLHTALLCSLPIKLEMRNYFMAFLDRYIPSRSLHSLLAFMTACDSFLMHVCHSLLLLPSEAGRGIVDWMRLRAQSGFPAGAIRYNIAGAAAVPHHKAVLV